MKSSEVYLYTIITLWTIWFLYYFGFAVWLSRTYERIRNTTQLLVTRISEIPAWLSQTRERIHELIRLWIVQLYDILHWIMRTRDRTHDSIRLWIVHAFATGGYIRETFQMWLQRVLNVLSTPRDECRKPEASTIDVMAHEHRDGDGAVEPDLLVSADEVAASVENARVPGRWVA